MTPEKKYETKIKNFLEKNKIVPFTSPNIDDIKGYYEKRHGTMYEKRGKPDLHITINGYSLEVEVKAESGKPSQLQLHNAKLILESGGLCFFAYPCNFERLQHVIFALINGYVGTAKRECDVNCLFIRNKFLEKSSQ